jgi:hypothetical protein
MYTGDCMKQEGGKLASHVRKDVSGDVHVSSVYFDSVVSSRSWSNLSF